MQYSICVLPIFNLFCNIACKLRILVYSRSGFICNLVCKLLILAYSSIGFICETVVNGIYIIHAQFGFGCYQVLDPSYLAAPCSDLIVDICLQDVVLGCSVRYFIDDTHPQVYILLSYCLSWLASESVSDYRFDCIVSVNSIANLSVYVGLQSIVGRSTVAYLRLYTVTQAFVRALTVPYFSHQALIEDAFGCCRPTCLSINLLVKFFLLTNSTTLFRCDSKVDCTINTTYLDAVLTYG